MILDHIDRADMYAASHPLFAEAFRFLREQAVPTLPTGRRELSGGAFALVSAPEGRGREGAKLEAHDRYIDIQFLIEGTEVIGWQDRTRCHQPEGTFNAEKDIGFYLDEPETWVTVNPGSFAVFFPGDAHAPLGHRGVVRKVVVKIPVSPR